MTKFSFLPVKKLSSAQFNDLELRYETEEVISLSSLDEMKLFVAMFGGTVKASKLSDITNVTSAWVIDKKLKVLDESSIENFYNHWLKKSQRQNDFGEFCQLVSFNSFLTTFNRAKYRVILQLD